MLRQKMGLGERLLIQDAFNLNTLAGLSRFIKGVLLGTFVIEGVGALLYATVFVPEFGWRGLWFSVFTAVSAFCNAGIDIIGDASLVAYATNPMINFVTAALVILGGIGYIVWWDLLRVVRERRNKGRRFFRHLTLHTKIALVTTFVLLFGGAVLILVCEYHNPDTIGTLSFFDKCQVSFFQSMTTRTAGFASVPQENFTNSASVVSLVLMVIGGSPVGTAGGMKTVTVVVLLVSAFATVRGKREATLFARRISDESIRKAIAVLATFLVVTFSSIFLLSLVCDAPFLDVVYEAVSASATVGLSRNLTSTLNTAGKCVIMATMYFGRVGPISFALALGGKGGDLDEISEPIEEISIG